MFKSNYYWDYADRLICYKNGSGTPSVFTQYDYSGQDRVSKLVRTGTSTSPIYERTIYIDGIFEYVKLENTSTYEKNYIHMMDDKSRIAEVRINPGTSFPSDITDDVTYHIEDQIGSSVLRLSTMATVIDQEEYYPFGDASYRTFTYKRYRYVAKERDDESGLYYYGARYYVPWLCRFISCDPKAAEFPNQSCYNYCFNNPINLVDKDGMAPGGPDDPPKDQPTLNAGIKITGALSGLNKGIGVTGSVFATFPGQNVSGEFGVNATATVFSKMLGNTTGGGKFYNLQIFGMVGHGNNSNLLGSNSTGSGISFFNPSSGGNSSFIGAGYAINMNSFTGGLSELSNRTGGLLLRGSFGDNNIGFSMFNDFAKAPHWGGGTDYGLTGTGEISFTRGLGKNETFSASIFFKDITGIPDKDPANRDFSGPRYNPKNPEGVYRTIGLNKDLNFGILGIKTTYSKSMQSGSFSLYRYGGKEGALFQDPIHNKMPAKTALFPYNMNNSKTGFEFGL